MNVLLTSKIPDVDWIDLIPRPPPSSYDEFKKAVLGKDVITYIEKFSGEYTTWWQDVYNWLHQGPIWNRSKSKVTVILIHFYFPIEEPTDITDEIFSYLMVTIKPNECKEILQKMYQPRHQVKITWVRWTIVLFLKNDLDSDQISNIISSIISLIGIGASKIIDIGAGLLGGLIPWLDRQGIEISYVKKTARPIFEMRPFGNPITRSTKINDLSPENCKNWKDTLNGKDAVFTKPPEEESEETHKDSESNGNGSKSSGDDNSDSLKEFREKIDVEYAGSKAKFTLEGEKILLELEGQENIIINREDVKNISGQDDQKSIIFEMNDSEPIIIKFINSFHKPLTKKLF